MKNLSFLFVFVLLSLPLQASMISAVPGPDDQGGMLMPMVSITATSGMGSNPSAGTVNIMFSPATTPVLRPLQEWSPGSWFADTAAWRADLGSPAGVGGTPAPNAGAGDLFNNQYGFMFMANGSMMMANVPTGNSLAIKLTSISSGDMEAFNYSNASNRWDEVWAGGAGSQVLWTGNMWHNYFTLPASAAPGTYTATFEIFVASTPFTGSTGFAQYDAAADAAVANPNFTSATLNYSFAVIPEPSTLLLLGLSGCFALALRRLHR
jgi:hypothetical protein